MKKIKILFTSIILLIGVMVVALYTNKYINTDKSAIAEVPDVDLSFSVISDIHTNTENVQKAIEDLYTINPNMDALVLNGDTVDQGIEKQYSSIEKTINKNKKYLPKTIIRNIGNHEFYDYSIDVDSRDQVQEFNDRYLKFSEEEKVYHDTWIKNFHFISLGSEIDSPDKVNFLTAYISENQIGWLKEKLSEKYEKGKPIFVFLHQPLNINNAGWSGVEQSAEIKDILEKYPEVILFTSHTHRDLDENSVILNQPFTKVHTGAIDYTIIPDKNSEGGRRKEPYIKGLYIEVKNNKVFIKGRNIKDKEWIFEKEISIN